jgi:[ribosomal protein S5]-alanine N-acetyltransferase
MRTVTTSVCTLEPQVEAHAPEMFTVLCDPAIYEFEGEPPPSVEALAAGYRRRETRRSPDGTEVLLNWVVRVPAGDLTGYVQATVMNDGCSCVGYEFSSRYWRRGIATAALCAVFTELRDQYDVNRVVAVLKTVNYRSMGLLQKLGFVEAPRDSWRRFEPASDETVLQAGLHAKDGI